MVATRAYTKLDKLEKRQEILMSAEDLFIKQNGEFPTVNAICTYSSMAKGTVYLYFKNKEEIILALLEKYFMQWLAPKTIPKETVEVEEVINALVSFVLQNPYKFRLLNAYNFLESKANSEKVVEFFKALMESFIKLSEHLSQLLDEPVEKINQWLMDSYYYIQGLWRTANPSFQNQAALANTSLEIFMPDFEQNAKRMMRLLWQESTS